MAARRFPPLTSIENSSSPRLGVPTEGQPLQLLRTLRSPYRLVNELPVPEFQVEQLKDLEVVVFAT